MRELQHQSNADLLQVATSKNYGRSTRKAARAILDERGVKIDDAEFENPSAGHVPTVETDSNRVYYYMFRLLFLVLFGAIALLIQKYR